MKTFIYTATDVQGNTVKNLILLAIAILLWKKPQEMPQLVSKPTQWIAINYIILRKP